MRFVGPKYDADTEWCRSNAAVDGIAIDDGNIFADYAVSACSCRYSSKRCPDLGHEWNGLYSSLRAEWILM